VNVLGQPNADRGWALSPSAPRGPLQSLSYRTFDKDQRVTHAAIVENKRLGAVLAYVKALQDQTRPPTVKTNSQKSGYQKTGRKRPDPGTFVKPITARPSPPLSRWLADWRSSCIASGSTEPSSVGRKKPRRRPPSANSNQRPISKESLQNRVLPQGGNVLRGTMDEASSLGVLCGSRLARSRRESDWAASFSDPMMGEPSGSSRREARTRGEHQTGKRRESRKALDLNGPNRDEPRFGAESRRI
jgi:hypothetical protein